MSIKSGKVQAGQLRNPAGAWQHPERVTLGTCHIPPIQNYQDSAWRQSDKFEQAGVSGRQPDTMDISHPPLVGGVKKAELWRKDIRLLPTQSSRPRTSPQAIKPDIVQAIVAERLKHGRCAEVVHYAVVKQGRKVSLRSVERTLDRHHLLKKRSPWKRPHDPTKRPAATQPGSLVQVDTVHFQRRTGHKRFYVFTLLDVHSRWAHAEVRHSLRAIESVRFVNEAQRQAPFKFQMLQSDHGPEFSTYFTRHVGTSHRHSRVRTPNDNAHLERFNRTIQDECLTVWPDPVRYQQLLSEWLPYYNKERMHLSLNFKTPLECCEGLVG